MGDKDLAEKILFGFADVFADLCNGVIFGVPGKVKPKDLQPYPTESVVLCGDSFKQGYRDVAKVYRRKGINLLLVGLENQTAVDMNMVARVMLADAMHYMNLVRAITPPKRKRVNNRRRNSRRAASKFQNAIQNARFPAVTYVLYMGYKRRWNGPRSLHEWLNLSPDLKPLVNDYRIQVIELAWLPKEMREKLTGDFRILVDALFELRTTGRYTGDSRKFRHKELLAVLRAITGNLYEGFNLGSVEEGETTMCESIARWINEVRNEGKKLGFADGKKQGFADGEKQGFANGEKQGFANGEKQGFANGEKQTSVKICRDFGKTQAETADYLVQKLHLSREQANDVVNTYW